MESINQVDCSLDIETITFDKLKNLIDDIFKYYEVRSRAICSEVSKQRRIARSSISEMVELALA